MTTQTYNSDIESSDCIEREPALVSDNRTETETIFSIKLLTIITILYIPIVILDFYYLFNDDSCVNNHINDSLKLSTYLVIDAIYGLTLVLFIPIILCIIDLDNGVERQAFCSISLFRTLFIFVWTSMGSYILTNTNECEKSIYYYMIVSLIIRYIFGILFIGINIEIL
jgi:hypothetical protein